MMRRAVMPPSTFLAALAQAEEQRHANRLASLKHVAGKIAMFEDTWRELTSRDVRVALESPLLDRWEDALSLTIGLISTHDNWLHDNLIDLGYREVNRSDYGTSFSKRTLKKGRLKVVVTVEFGHEWTGSVPEATGAPT